MWWVFSRKGSTINLIFSTIFRKFLRVTIENILTLKKTKFSIKSWLKNQEVNKEEWTRGEENMNRQIFTYAPIISPRFEFPQFPPPPSILTIRSRKGEIKLHAIIIVKGDHEARHWLIRDQWCVSTFALAVPGIKIANKITKSPISWTNRSRIDAWKMQMTRFRSKGERLEKFEQDFHPLVT